eukprot:8837304-Alexandrium_andersonii.AAC.2
MPVCKHEHAMKKQGAAGHHLHRNFNENLCLPCARLAHAFEVTCQNASNRQQSKITRGADKKQTQNTKAQITNSLDLQSTESLLDIHFRPALRAWGRPITRHASCIPAAWPTAGQ